MMMKRLWIALCALCLLLPAAAMAEDGGLSIYAMKGPTGIGLVQLMDSEDWQVTLVGAPDEAVAAVLSGAADLAAVPTNLAATLYNKTGGQVRLLALNTLGVLHILENRETIHDVADLAGRTLYATGQGSTPEYVLNYILAAHGLTEQVTVEYKAEHAELATLAAAGQVDLVMLPEPNVTAVLNQNADFRRALDVTALYNDAAAQQGAEGATMSMGCVIARAEVIEKRPEQVAAFMAAYARSVAFVNDDPEAASVLVEQAGIMPKAALARQAIPNCHIVFIEGQEMKDMIVPFFQVLHEANAKAVGGALPGDDFYHLPDHE